MASQLHAEFTCHAVKHHVAIQLKQ